MRCRNLLHFFTAATLFVSALRANAAGAEEPAAEANRGAVERLKRAIERDYSYRDLRKVDWQKRLAEFEPRLLEAKDADAFAKETAELLKAAGDVHIWLKVKDKTIGTFHRDARLNFNPRVLPKLIPQLKQHGRTVLTGSFDDGVRYVAIGTWENREPQSLAKAIEAIAEAAADKAPLIIDVRPNAGGSELSARQVAGMFVKKPTVYSKNFNLQNGKERGPYERLVEPDKEGRHHPGPCLVLMGEWNMSSCESFLQMMREAGSKLVGEKSYGASGNPKPHELGNGVTVFLPSWRDLALDGNDQEGVGISPDVVVETKREDFETGDPVLVRALELIRPKP
jgi:C-terminal processing protease CtpA/Prc